MLARLTPQQVDEWEAFDALEPLGGARAIRGTLALAASALCHAQGLTVDPNLFLARWETAEQRQTPEEQQAVLEKLGAL